MSRSSTTASAGWAVPHLRALASQACVAAITTGCVLTTTHLVISEAGTAAFAAVALVGSLISLMTFLDLGTSAAITEAVATASGDSRGNESVIVTLRTVSRVSCAAACALATAATLCYLSSTWQWLLGDASNSTPKLALAATGVMIVYAFTLPLSASRALLLGSGKNHLAVLTQGVTAPTVLLVSVVILWLPIASAWLVIAPGLGILAAALLCSMIGYRVTGWIPVLSLLRILQIRRYPGTKIAHQSLPMVVVMIGLPLGLHTDRLILSHVSTNDGLALYSAAAQVYTPCWGLLGAASMAFWPAFSNLRSRGESGGRLLRNAVAMSSFLGLGGGAVLLILTPHLTNMISGGRLVADHVLAGGFACLLLVQAVQLPYGMYLMDSWGLRFQAVTVLLMVLVNVPLSVVLAQALGPAGPAYASATSILICQALPCYLYARQRIMRGETKCN